AEGPAAGGPAGVKALRFLEALPPVGGDGRQFLVIDPDEAGFPGTAVAAARTPEAQPIFEPRFGHKVSVGSSFRRRWHGAMRAPGRYGVIVTTAGTKANDS